MKKWMIILILGVLVLVFTALMLTVGPAKLSVGESLAALFGNGEATSIRIVQNIRLPRMLAALAAGAGLSLAGLIMQSTLGNPMASPTTLGVSNAAVLGANVAIIAFAGGFVSTGNNAQNYLVGIDPFSTSSIAFVFAVLSAGIVLLLSRVRSFSSEAVVLSGIALGAAWSAGTTLLQYYATDIGLSAAVTWTFGDLGRATFTMDFLMLGVVAAAIFAFCLLSWRLNALGLGKEGAESLGVKVTWLRFFSLLVASLVTAVIVSFLGLIGFVGIICPHAMRRVVGNNHRYLIPASVLSGSLLIMVGDVIATLIGSGTAIPIGAVTALLGVPFFLYLILAKKGNKA